MVDKIAGDLVQPFPGRNNVVISFQFLFQTLLDVNILSLQLLQLLGDTLVKVAHRDSQLIPSGIIIKRNRGIIFDGPLEIIGRYIFSKNPAGNFFLLEKGGAGESNVTCLGEGISHVECQEAVLGTMGLIGNDNKVIPLGVSILRVHVFIKFLDQGKDIGLMLAEQIG